MHPNIRRVWQVIALILTVPPALAVIIAGSVFGLPVLTRVIIGLALMVPVFVVPNRAYDRWRYAIRERDLYTSKGAIWHVETLVPFDRIQFVESRQGPLDRAFTLTQVVVYTAAGKAARIPGLDRATAELIREELSQVAGAASV